MALMQEWQGCAEASVQWPLRFYYPDEHPLWNSPSCQVSLIFRDISHFASSIPFVPAPSGIHIYSQSMAWDLHGSRWLKVAFRSCLLKQFFTWVFKQSSDGPGASGSSFTSLSFLWSYFLSCGVSEDSSRGFLKDKLQNFSKFSVFWKKSKARLSSWDIFFFPVCIFNCRVQNLKLRIPLFFHTTIKRTKNVLMSVFKKKPNLLKVVFSYHQVPGELVESDHGDVWWWKTLFLFWW